MWLVLWRLLGLDEEMVEGVIECCCLATGVVWWLMHVIGLECLLLVIEQVGTI